VTGVAASFLSVRRESTRLLKANEFVCVFMCGKIGQQGGETWDGTAIQLVCTTTRSISELIHNFSNLKSCMNGRGRVYYISCPTSAKV
jgi:hypothetical protein